MAPTRVYLVDKNNAFASAALGFLTDRPDVDVVGSAASAEEADGQLTALRPDLVLFSLEPQDLIGLVVPMRWKALPSPPRVVALSDHDEPPYRALAAAVQADGFVLKREFATAILPHLENARNRTTEKLSVHPPTTASLPLPIAPLPKAQPYGDLSELNTVRAVLDSVGPQILQDIAGDYLDLLGTSAAIYERNGDYALGIFTSGWCRTLDNASRNLCATADNREALHSGKWLCHESCWQTSWESIETAASVDLPCSGGLRIYAVPIRARGEVIGSINFGYGDPPRDSGTLERLAQQYNVELGVLERAAATYESRSSFIVEMAKSRLATAARLIGEIVDRRMTERELRASEQQLQHAQKMETVGELASGIAHDINNLLTVIFGAAAILRSDASAERAGARWIDRIEDAAGQAANITRGLLTFARKSHAEKRTVNLCNVTRRACRMLDRLLPANIKLHVADDREPIWVCADETQIQQVILNLCINARDAMPAGGALRVSLERAAPQAAAGQNETEAAGGFARLHVCDTGSGIPPDIRTRIFEPFFTTKRPGHGTGLGLAITQTIVLDHGGTIAVESGPGGSEFTVTLPCLASHTAECPNETPAPVGHGHGELILLAEDHHQVRELLVSSLRAAGFEVAVATDGAGALDLLTRHGACIRVAILDVDLPKLSGLDCLKQIRRSHPQLPVILATGNFDAQPADALDPHTTVLHKPFQIRELTRQVASRALAAATPCTVVSGLAAE